MTSRTLICLAVLAALLFALSCAKIPEQPAKTEGGVTLEQLPYEDAVPAEWGEVFAVSNEPGNLDWAQLWFRDDDGNVRMVSYNLRTNSLSKDTVLIRRR